MKTPFITLLFTIIATHYFSQTNSLPSTGNVGIGTTAPTSKLQVNGSALIDSMLLVKDSIVINKTATVKSDLKVVGNSLLKNDLKVVGNTTLVGTTTIKEGDLKIKSLGDSTLANDGVLMINANGKVKNGGDLKSLVYSESEYTPCKDENGGNTTPTSPIWLNGLGKLYTSNHCVPDVKVGIGQNDPDSKLHITTAVDRNTHPIIVDKRIQGTTTPYKLMELDNNGLLYAREIKVNLDAWPDYVFDEGYQLMPLSELQAFIQQNDHLPNVPSACEMEEEGVNVAKSNVMLMEKVEELTLYLLQMKEQLDTQNQLLLQQQETILQLQKQVKP
nr:hypothetical protein [uncultured Fluviicola sp.]